MSLPNYTRVDSKDDFLNLVARLAADREARQWSNNSSPEFVAALGSWLEDADGFYLNTDRALDTSKPSWQLFADMLQAARFYE